MLMGVAAGVAVVLVLGAAGVLPGVDRFLGSYQARSPHFKRGDLNQRLASLSLNGRVSIWGDSWHDFTAHPVAGVGAGGFEAPLIRRTVQTTPLRPHSLELGALAELGFIGGALVLVSLALPLLAIRAASRIEPLAPAVAGTFVGLLAQATLDWTWDVAAVALLGTLSGALLIAWSGAETRSEQGVASP
jgi:O-antigen ligase